MKCFLYVDGASRGNPGEASVGCSLQNEKNEEIGKVSKKIGIQTNNVAEYEALLCGLDLALDNNVSNVVVRSDSQLMVRQILGEYKVKEPHLKKMWEKAKTVIEKFKQFKIEHVRRELNKRADALANQALDED